MNYDEVMSILTILTLTSASVERFLEVLSKIIESLGLFSKEKRGKLASYAEELMKRPEPQSESDSIADDALGSAEGDPSAVVILAAGEMKDLNLATKKFILQIGGCLVGIFLCWRGELALFKMLGAELGTSAGWIWFDYVLTGILIGTGTEPIHALVRFLQAKHDLWRVPEATPEPTLEETVEEPVDLEKATPMIDVPYFGGLKPEMHQNRIRKENPDMIIYHHTGMYSDTTFEDVVRVFEARGFPTGFNAVITSDGKCHNYCRWDARGIHAQGFNERSLGLAFCGCFDSDPNVPGSNIDGEMGNMVPTNEQLLTGAKVAALWSLLYQIDLKQKHGLTPHMDVAPDGKPTACPGNQFPHARFRTLVERFVDEWTKSTQAQSEIQDFAMKKYIFVK